MRFKRKLHIVSAALLCAATGCQDLVYDYEGDCETVVDVRFVYNHNLKWADAFSSEVNAVTLYVFDAVSGKHVTTISESGDALAADNYRMRLDIPAGEYEFVAWCGEGAHDEGRSFSVAPLEHTSAMREHLTCKMTRQRHPETGCALVNQENGLQSLFHGHMKAEIPDEEGLKLHLNMPLVKNTNSIRIILQSLSGKEIQPSMYGFTIEDNNGYMDWDNTLLDDESLTYHAWSVTGGSAEIIDDETKASDGKTMSAVVADLTFGRMMTNHRPMLTVSDVSGDKNKTIFKIPLIDYALMIKGKYGKDLSDQEYLDRQDDYNMTFFLDDNNQWINAFIYINKWKVVLEEFDID